MDLAVRHRAAWTLRSVVACEDDPSCLVVFISQFLQEEIETRRRLSGNIKDMNRLIFVCEVLGLIALASV